MRSYCKTRVVRAAAASLLLVATAGCSLTGSHHAPIATQAVSPIVTGPGDVVIGGPALDARPVTFVDRHPLLRTPVEFYHKTNAGCVGKTAAATFLGVPAGVVLEVGQIIAGCPPERVDYGF